MAGGGESCSSALAESGGEIIHHPWRGGSGVFRRAALLKAAEMAWRSLKAAARLRSSAVGENMRRRRRHEGVSA